MDTDKLEKTLRKGGLAHKNLCISVFIFSIFDSASKVCFNLSSLIFLVSSYFFSVSSIFFSREFTKACNKIKIAVTHKKSWIVIKVGKFSC